MKLCLAAFCVSSVTWMASAALPSDWQHEQRFEVAAPGLVKFSLPAATLDAARAGLQDLRLYDGAGSEVPFLIQRPLPAPKVTRPAKSFAVSLNPNSTIVTIETGLTQPLDAIALETPASEFIKAVQVEGSVDGEQWKPLGQGLPIFRQFNGASQLRLAIPAGNWPWLRLTVDDKRSQPVPFTGARVFAAAAEVAPTEPVPATIIERNENPGESRLTLNLGAANLDIASIRIETEEPLFTRQVALAVSQISEDAVREMPIGGGLIYRVEVDGLPASSNMIVPLEQRVGSRELLVLIRNNDSPPLPVTAVHAERRPVYLVFLARAAGTFHLLTGNPRCAAPSYDLAALGSNLKNASLAAIQLSSIAANPEYHAPEALPGLDVTGAPLDVTDWKYCKPIALKAGGAQQIELDLDVLANAQPGFSDLRLLRGSNQVPYLIQRTSISRVITPAVTLTNDAKQPKLSRWLIKLPKADLPITRITCTSRTPLFERNMSLIAEYTDERGDVFRRQITSAVWSQTPDRKNKEFSLFPNSIAPSETLILETVNGDNPAIELEKFEAFYPATRILFKAKADDEVFLYYGNPRVSPPSYDLSLVAGELLSAEKNKPALGAEELLKKPSWAEGRVPGKGGVLFWGILAVVVIGLLVIISRLLPKTPST